MTARPIEISVHNALVLATAPLLMIVPYLLTFSPGIGFLTFFLGAALMGVALAGATPQRKLSLSAHRRFRLGDSVSQSFPSESSPESPARTP